MPTWSEWKFPTTAWVVTANIGGSEHEWHPGAADAIKADDNVWASGYNNSREQHLRFKVDNPVPELAIAIQYEVEFEATKNGSDSISAWAPSLTVSGLGSNNVGETVWAQSTAVHTIAVSSIGGDISADSTWSVWQDNGVGNPKPLNLDYVKVRVKYAFVSETTASPGQGQSVGGAPKAWSNPDQVTAADTTYAVQNLAFSAAGNDWHHATNFGLAIPSASSILGIQVRVSGTIVSAGTGLGNLDNIQLIDAGVRGGDDLGDNGGIESWLSLGDWDRTKGGLTETWGFSLTPGMVNASNFGVATRYLDLNPSNLELKVDHIQLIIYEEVDAIIGVNKNQIGHEIQQVPLSKNMVVQNAEFGNEIMAVAARLHSPENRFGWEVGSVAVTRNIVTQNSEYGNEVGEPASLTQVHEIQPSKNVYGVDILSVGNHDIFNEYGLYIPSVGLTQQHSFGMGDSNMEMGNEIADAPLTQLHILAIGGGKNLYGWEGGSPGILQIQDVIVTPFYEAGFEADSVDIVQQHNMLIGKTLLGNEIDSVDLVQQHNLTVSDTEIGHEVQSADFSILYSLNVGKHLIGFEVEGLGQEHIRIYRSGWTPQSRNKLVRAETRTITVVADDRTLVV